MPTMRSVLPLLADVVPDGAVPGGAVGGVVVADDCPGGAVGVAGGVVGVPGLAFVRTKPLSGTLVELVAPGFSGSPVFRSLAFFKQPV
jgi:hypothetical protein